ncbi:hypothetical protein [Ferrovibrio sp.]|uniref:hypothetical protein n=1 Tax=Ferrovibrio sp. TaxID=1917215 RepID=UPI00311D8A9F
MMQFAGRTAADAAGTGLRALAGAWLLAALAALPARADPYSTFTIITTRSASQPALLAPCPLFAGPADPAWCRTALSAPAAAPLPDAYADFLPFGGDGLLDFGAMALLLEPEAAGHAAGAEPVAWLYGNPAAPGAAGPPLVGDLAGGRFSLMQSGAREHGGSNEAGFLRAAYDVPFIENLSISTRSTVSEGVAGDAALSRTSGANSGLSVIYAEDGITFALEPAVATNWSDGAGGETRIGIDSSLSSGLGRDLLLTLASGYDAFIHAGDPLQNSRALRHRLALAWGRADGWRFGLSGRSRSEQSFYEERLVYGPGLFATLPLDETLDLTLRNDFSFTRSNTREMDGPPQQDYRNSFGLQAGWSPPGLPVRAMRVVASYTLSYDTALAEMPSLYETLARLALAMRF